MHLCCLSDHNLTVPSELAERHYMGEGLGRRERGGIREEGEGRD